MAMSVEQKVSAADDVISMLSGFDISYTDSREILSKAYQKITRMGSAEFDELGKPIKDFNNAALAGKAEQQKQLERSRIFHEPQGEA